MGEAGSSPDIYKNLLTILPHQWPTLDSTTFDLLPSRQCAGDRGWLSRDGCWSDKNERIDSLTTAPRVGKILYIPITLQISRQGSIKGDEWLCLRDLKKKR